MRRAVDSMIEESARETEGKAEKFHVERPGTEADTTKNR